MPTTIRLLVLTGPHKGTRYCVRGLDSATLGRSRKCDIHLCGQGQDLCISRRHCRLTFDPPTVLVADLGSLNGTYINGHACAVLTDDPQWRERVMQAKDGDVLTIGGASLQIKIIDECTKWDEEQGINTACRENCT